MRTMKVKRVKKTSLFKNFLYTIIAVIITFCIILYFLDTYSIMGSGRITDFGTWRLNHSKSDSGGSGSSGGKRKLFFLKYGW